MLSKRLLVTIALTVTALLCAVGTTSLPAAASTTSGENVPLPGGPLVTRSTSGGTGVPTISLNWSGYVATSNTPFTYVHSTFIEPTLTCTGAPNLWTSNWAGLDGFTSATVEQDGTFASCGGPDNLTPQYEAWYEMYPSNSVNVFPVNAGDVISSSVEYANGLVTLTISDLTTRDSATDVATCSSCERSSAEWIVERPAECNNALTQCFLTELADFGTSTMTQDLAQAVGTGVQGVGAFTNTPIFMVNPLSSGGFISLDDVSALSGTAFTVTWERSGTVVPISL